MISQVNILARKVRHQKLFQESGSFVRYVPNVLRGLHWLKSFNIFIKEDVRTRLFVFKNTTDAVNTLVDPAKVLFNRVCLITIFFFSVGALNVGASERDYDFSYSSEFDLVQTDISTYLADDFIINEEGYIVKTVPSQTDLSKVLNREGFAQHEVQPGEYLALIGSKYGLSVTTLMWANRISDNTILYPGQTLLIPQSDGVTVTVKKGDTIEKFAQGYKVSSNLIASVNSLEGGMIYEGQKLLIPGARPLPPTQPRYAEVSRSASKGRVASSQARVEKVNVQVKDRGITSLLFPTHGKITQGYHSGHWAIDIADPSMPSVIASAPGVVEIASTGTWAGGYGNYLLINHGGGLQTRYAHLNKLYVSAGESVAAGEVIAQMGRSGRVRGITGIHLHFEVVIDGVKVNPWNMIGK